MRRSVSKLKPFEFQSDFSAPPATEPETEDRLSISAKELAALVAQARSEGEASAAAAFAGGGEAEARLKASTAKLNDALADLVELAVHLEASAKSDGLSEEARRLINQAASRIIDGQGDLFRAPRDETRTGEA